MQFRCTAKVSQTADADAIRRHSRNSAAAGGRAALIKFLPSLPLLLLLIAIDRYNEGSDRDRQHFKFLSVPFLASAVTECGKSRS